jgi:CheY-like chemotaxis protein
MDAPRIVVVDDNPEVLAEVSQVLRDAGYDAVGCLSTAAAAASVCERQPALVITELRVEQVFAGLSVLQMLQQNPETAHIPIILWSADLAALARVRELNDDTVTTILKPLTPQQLLELVAERCAPAAGA